MEEMGRQPISFREFVQQVMSGMAQGGRAGQAYGGSANPTYTQSRKQRMAGGGIAGLRQIGKPGGIVEPGISGYGFFDFLDPVKDFVMEKAVPTVMDFFGKGKDVITKMPQGSPGQLNPLKDVISKMPQASPIQMAKDAMRGSPIQMAKDAAKQVVTKMPQGSPFQLNKPIEDLAKQYSLVNDPFVGDQDLSDEAKEAAEMAQGPDPYRNIFDTGAISFPKPSAEKEGGIWDAIKTGASNVWDWGTEQFGTQDPYVKDGETIYPVNWKGPLAIGTAAGAAQAAMPKAKLPQDTSGIDIANIRSRALTGSDPDLHFLPPASATTAYAQGGRTGYQDAGEVQQDVFMAWDEYKSGGGEENFNDWFNDIYLSGAGTGVRSPQDLMEIERKAEALVQAGVVENKADAVAILQRSYPKPSLPTSDSYMKPMSAAMEAPKDFEGIMNRTLRQRPSWPAGREQFEDDLPYGAAQGGRIGAQEGGLMNLGGMEKDYRQEGGFVPIGGEERADDVPARLSKNEFVFTADAVRAAGGGDIDAGAEVMENLMNNLERGGQVSEESQGLEGARNMFATAQRLEGVM